MGALLHDSETFALRFDSHQDTLDFQAKLLQDSEDWLARNDRNFVDRYKRKEIEIVIPCRIRNDDRAEPDDYQLVVSAVPPMGIGHGERPTESFSKTLTCHMIVPMGVTILCFFPLHNSFNAHRRSSPPLYGWNPQNSD